MKLIHLFIVTILMIFLFALWQHYQLQIVSSDPVSSHLSINFSIDEKNAEPIKPIPLHIELDPKIVALGQKLFHDTRLSADNTISCEHCHQVHLGGMDKLPVSLGIKGHKAAVNAPTVFNSGFNFLQFWDGRAATLEEQIDGPIHNPNEMGSSWAEILPKLQQDVDYLKTFAQLFSDGIQVDNIKHALATFERALYTPNSRFDQFLRGNKQALTQHEQKGYQRFKEYGCISCHQGINIGGNMFQVFGVIGDYFADRGNITQQDLGRYNVTGREEDKYTFKVPSLRNVALTAPYFHDGQTQTLEKAVRIMMQYQLGRIAETQDVELLVSFLHTLTGDLPLQYATFTQGRTQ